MALSKVLPATGEPDSDSAAGILRSVVAESANVVYVLLHHESGGERMKEVALGRAEAIPNVRRVVYVPDSSVLDPEQLEDIRGGARGRSIAAVYGIGDKIAARLSIGNAIRADKVEAAFTKAEQQRSTP